MNRIVMLTLGLLACSDDATNTSTALPDAGGGTSTLYSRLGGKTGITSAVDSIVAEELKDAEIAAFFGGLGTGGAPTATQLKECLVNQLGAAAGGPAAEVSYPTTVSGGFTCRDMKSSHAKLAITGPVFDKFVTVAAGVLKKAGVADADIATVGGVLNSTKGDIVTK